MPIATGKIHVNIDYQCYFIILSQLATPSQTVTPHEHAFRLTTRLTTSFVMLCGRLRHRSKVNSRISLLRRFPYSDGIGCPMTAGFVSNALFSPSR